MKTWYKITTNSGWYKANTIDDVYKNHENQKKWYDSIGKECPPPAVKRIIKITEEEIEVPEDLK
jgi:hypothetical protein